MPLALSWQVITVSCASTFPTFRDARARAMTDLPAGRSPREFTLTLACLIQFIHSGLRSWMSNVDTCHKSGLPVPVVFFSSFFCSKRIDCEDDGTSGLTVTSSVKLVQLCRFLLTFLFRSLKTANAWSESTHCSRNFSSWLCIRINKIKVQTTHKMRNTQNKGHTNRDLNHHRQPSPGSPASAWYVITLAVSGLGSHTQSPPSPPPTSPTSPRVSRHRCVHIIINVFT